MGRTHDKSGTYIILDPPCNSVPGAFNDHFLGKNTGKCRNEFKKYLPEPPSFSM